MSVNEKFLEEYSIKVGEKIYIFKNVALEKSPIGKWGLSYGKMREMMKAIAAIILADKDQPLTFAELEHLAQTAELSMAKVAELIKVDRSTITKWKSAKVHLPFADSYCLKDKFPKLIFDFDDRNNDAKERANFWFDKGKLPRPSDAA